MIKSLFKSQLLRHVLLVFFLFYRFKYLQMIVINDAVVKHDKKKH